MELEPSDLDYMLLNKDAEPMRLPLSLLKTITDNFSEVIGDGGFSVVYKGKLDDGRLVAVKKLKEETMEEKSFEREAACLMKVKHDNIVRFLGYCGLEESEMRTEREEWVKASREQMLLCFEYVPMGSLENYIKDPSEGLDWSDRYKIIKGICAGLDYIHRNKMVHLDLKPGNVLLDENMVPKITDFGLARSFKADKNYATATNSAGTYGYIAPEYDRTNITEKFDLYSLGIVILEIITGRRGHKNVDDVLASWSKRLETSDGTRQWEQIQVCGNIGIKCINADATQRPGGMKDIMDMLDAVAGSSVISTASGHNKMLDVHPFALCFPFEPNQTTHCSLHLTNETDGHVAFSLAVDASRKSPQHCFVRLPLHGVVPPRSACTLVLTTRDKNTHPEKLVIDLVLRSTRLSTAQDSETFHSQPDNFLNKAKEMQEVFQEVTLKAVYNPRQGLITSSKKISSRIKILSKDITYKTQYSLDANQTKQWIIIGEDYGHIRIWNYRMQKKVYSLKVSKERVTCVKFIARKQWLVAGTANGHVHVYDCETQLKKIICFRAADKYLFSLTVHPTQPYLLLVYDHEMQLLDWDKNWECTQTFEEERTDILCQVVFTINGNIASALKDHTVKVWSIHSPKCSYTFSEHSNKVNCLHFFTFEDHEYLVTGSDDCTAKIWDMQNKRCVNTLEASLSPVICVSYEANLQIVFTVSKDGSVNYWRATNSRINPQSYRLERIINIGCSGAFHGITCLNRRIVIGTEYAMAIIDIDDLNDQEESTDCSKPQLNEETRRGDAISVTAGSSSELLVVDPQKLVAPYSRPSMTETEPCFLNLTNNTDEYVAFRLIDKNPSPSFHYEKAYPYGIVPPRLRYTFFVKLLGTRDSGYQFPSERKGLCLESTTLGDGYMVPFKDQFECDDFFGETIEMGNIVNELTLEAVEEIYYLEYDEPIKLKITSTMGNRTLRCIDAHPTEPWLISGHVGHVIQWKYDNSKHLEYQGEQTVVRNQQVPIEEQPQIPSYMRRTSADVNSIKFIPSKKQIIIGTDDGLIHVYKCARVAKRMETIKSFRDHDINHGSGTSLAVHPIQPYVLSTSLKLWNWNKNWKCTQTFRHADPIREAVFNPDDANCFATAPHNHPIVQVWSSDSPEPIYTLSGHSEKVNCLAFFRGRRGRQFLITGSDDGTAKIWDLQIKSCIHTLEAFMSSVTCVSALPGRPPYLLTGSENGSIYVWRTTDFRLQRVVHYGFGGPVRGIVCLMGSRRAVIGQDEAISIMDFEEEEAYASECESNIDIDNEEAVARGNASNTYYDIYRCISWLPGILCSICKNWSR